MTSRRTFLTRATSATVALGALIAGGALMRSCAPRTERTSVFDLSDMQADEMRYYAMDDRPEIIMRTADSLHSFSATCPVSNGLGFLQYDSFLDGLWCSHCTNRFNRAGALTNRAGGPSTWDRAGDYALSPGTSRFDGLTMTLSESDPRPALVWSSL